MIFYIDFVKESIQEDLTSFAICYICKAITKDLNRHAITYCLCSDCEAALEAIPFSTNEKADMITSLLAISSKLSTTKGEIWGYPVQSRDQDYDVFNSYEELKTLLNILL